MNLPQNIGLAKIKPAQYSVTEQDYCVHPAIKKDLDMIVATVQNIKDFGTQMGHRNFIFSGPPGTGKTLAVKRLATILQMPLYDAKIVMDANRISALFTQLREQTKTQKCLVLFDELDRFSSRTEIVDPTQQQTLNQLLTELDGMESNNGFFIIGTTNRPNSVDIALRRPGRFSKEIRFMPPDREGRLKILYMHASGRGNHKFEVEMEELENAANVTYGYTGADLVGLLNEAFAHATLDKRTKTTRKDFEHALKNTKPSALRDMPFREPRYKLETLGGYELHKEVLRRIRKNSTGTTMLFYGPKGTGKTAFAEAFAGEYGLNFITVSGSAPEDKFVGETQKEIKEYLERAKQLAPCVLLFDEIDSLVEKKGMSTHKGSWTGLLQAELSTPIEGVYIIGTVNRPDLLNGTFIDRFVHKMYFGMPTEEDQKKIWEKTLPKEISAMELIRTNNKLSCRQIADAHKLLRDFGITSSQEAYAHVIKTSARAELIDYDAIIAMTGDSVQNYTRIMELTGAALK